MHRQLRAPQGECPVPFWRFAGPVIAGNLAALGAGLITRSAAAELHPKTRQTAATFASMGAFWLVAGLGWVIANRKG